MYRVYCTEQKPTTTARRDVTYITRQRRRGNHHHHEHRRFKSTNDISYVINCAASKCDILYRLISSGICSPRVGWMAELEGQRFYAFSNGENSPSPRVCNLTSSGTIRRVACARTNNVTGKHNRAITRKRVTAPKFQSEIIYTIRRRLTYTRRLSYRQPPSPHHTHTQYECFTLRFLFEKYSVFFLTFSISLHPPPSRPFVLYPFNRFSNTLLNSTTHGVVRMYPLVGNVSVFLRPC